MIHPTDRQYRFPLAVRDGHPGPVTCAACGCRLDASDDGVWRHFNPLAGRDARGCIVACADLAHDERGFPLTI